MRGLARLLRLRLRDTDLVSHFEAGEFALVLPETAPEQALVMVDNLKALYAALPQSDHEAVFHCSLSAGLASMRPEQDGDSLIDEARRALHAARRAGSQHLMGNAA